MILRFLNGLSLKEHLVVQNLSLLQACSVRGRAPLTIALLVLLGLSSLKVSEARVFNYPESSRPRSLIPFFADDMSEVRLMEFLFDSLVMTNRRGEVEGALATRWSEASDQRSITFDLREGVKWHDGRPFTADDVIFTIQAAQHPRTVFSEKGQFSFIRSMEKSGRISSTSRKVQLLIVRSKRFRVKTSSQ